MVFPGFNAHLTVPVLILLKLMMVGAKPKIEWQFGTSCMAVCVTKPEGSGQACHFLRQLFP